MTKINIHQHPEVHQKIAAYPDAIRVIMEQLRDLIIETASEMDLTGPMEISLKWGEPTFKTRNGSPVRIGWKAKTPDQYAIYFICTTPLVETFRRVYGGLFDYEKNRAIVFNLNDTIPVNELKDCISLALDYKTLKDKPFLGR